MLTQDGGQFGIIATECIHYFSYCSDKITSQRRLILAHTLAGYNPSWWGGVVTGLEVPSWWGVRPSVTAFSVMKEEGAGVHRAFCFFSFCSVWTLVCGREPTTLRHRHVPGRIC